MSADPLPQCAPGLNVYRHDIEGVVVLNCVGRLTAENAGYLKSEVKALFPRHKRVLLDLAHLAYMDSAGLGVLVSLYVSARSAHCEFHLTNLNKRIKELLGLSKVLSLFEACGKYLVKMP